MVITISTKPWLGMHSSRRSSGKRMLEAGILVDELSQILGHTDIDSSKPYLGTNEIGLIECPISLSDIEKAGGEIMRSFDRFCHRNHPDYFSFFTIAG